MKNVIKILSIVILIILILSNFVFASGDSLAIDPFLNEDVDNIDVEKDALNSVLSIIQVIGIAVATIMLIVIAIKYMIASASDRADIKKHAIIYVTGAILLFGASGIVQIIKGFSNNLN